MATNEIHPDAVRALLPEGRQLLYLSTGNNQNNQEWQHEYRQTRARGMSARFCVDVQAHSIDQSTWAYSVPEGIDVQPILDELRLKAKAEEA